jgi:Transposase DDE domain
MGDDIVRYVGGWIGRQCRLFPHVAEEIDPITAKLEQLIIILDTLGLEAYVASPSRGPGRPPEDRPAIARAFVGKAVLNIPTTFSRVFREFADHALPERVHEQLIRHGLGEHLLGHLARDATEIDGREKPRRRPPDEPPPPAAPRRRRGRPRKSEMPPPKPPSRLERQRTQSVTEMRAELPTGCDIGLKRNAKGFTSSWIGYKLHLDVCEAGIPVAAILTSASTHDSQVAIPLARTSQQRVTWCYDIMDAAYDAQAIVEDSLAQGRIPVIDINPRADKDRKAEILAERARRALINIPDRDDELYKIRTVAERANARLKDEFGARNLRVRGHAKALCHLMLGVAALAADTLVRLSNRRPFPLPA